MVSRKLPLHSQCLVRLKRKEIVADVPLMTQRLLREMEQLITDSNSFHASTGCSASSNAAVMIWAMASSGCTPAASSALAISLGLSIFCVWRRTITPADLKLLHHVSGRAFRIQCQSVVGITITISRHENSEISFGIQPDQYIPDGFPILESPDSHFLVNTAIAGRFRPQGDSLWVLASVHCGKFNRVVSTKGFFFYLVGAFAFLVLFFGYSYHVKALFLINWQPPEPSEAAKICFRFSQSLLFWPRYRTWI